MAGLSDLKVKVTQSCPTLCNPMDCPWNSPSQDTGVGSHSLLQGIFPTQESNTGLLHGGRILYHLSHQGSLNWKAAQRPGRYCKQLSRKEDVIKQRRGTFLVVQWLRIHLPMQRMWVRSLARELGSHMAQSSSVCAPQPERSLHTATKTLHSYK